MRLNEHREDEQTHTACGFVPEDDHVQLTITIRLEGDRTAVRVISDAVRTLVNQKIVEANT